MITEGSRRKGIKLFAMKENELFKMALGLKSPWEVKDVSFSVEEKRLDIDIDFPRGAEFACPVCGQKNCKAYDSQNSEWRHLNFFQHTTYLHARRPRIDCPNCGIKSVEVPWGRPGSGFTHLFEAFVMILAKEMPVSAIAALLCEHDTRIWRVIRHYVDEARSMVDLYEVDKIGADETARSRGHNYVTVFVDMDESRVIYATEGKNAETFAHCNQYLFDHGGDPDYIKEVSCDMSPAFIEGARDFFVNSKVTFDKFHIMKIINEAVDKVRRFEQRERPELKKSRYIWLRNPENLNVKQKEQYDNLSDLNLMTATAYQMKLNFQEFWKQGSDKAEDFLNHWCSWIMDSKLEPMKEAVLTIKRHWDGILRWFKSGLNNGILEGKLHYNDLPRSWKIEI